MRDAAERCDDPWDICWWGSFGSNANSLRKSAENLEKAAERLENKATALDAQAAALLQCCQFATREEQEHCFETIPAAGGIGTPQSCPEAIRDSIDIWAEEIREDWRTIYLELAPQIAEIAAYVIVCDWTAIYPIPGPDPCCMKYPPQELIPWLRPCHRPNPYRFPKIDECDIGGILRKCSLDKILADLVIKVNDYMDEIDSLNDKITRMRNCCILNNPEEWMKCIDDIDKEE
jgi:chaperonin cofactor prefoldin